VAKRVEIPDIGVIEYSDTTGRASVFRFDKGDDRLEFRPQGVVLFDGGDMYGAKESRSYTSIPNCTVTGRQDGSIRIVRQSGTVAVINITPNGNIA
jgi:hypothetical protein